MDAFLRIGSNQERQAKAVREADEAQLEMLFVEKERDYMGDGQANETTYAFLDRTAKPEYGRIRAMLNRWFARYPPDRQYALAQRMRHRRGLKRERQFQSAFFELYLHEFLRGTGGQVAVEPVPDSPFDFHVEEGNLCYRVEAADVWVNAGTHLEEDANALDALDWLYEIEASDFRLSVTIRGRLQKTLSKKCVQRPFRDLLERARRGSLSPGESLAEVRQGKWILTGRLVAPAELGMKTFEYGTVVCQHTRAAGFSDPIGSLQNKVEKKAERYKGTPLIVAVRNMPYGMGGGSGIMVDALIGRTKTIVSVPRDAKYQGPLPSPSIIRDTDGVWGGPKDARYPDVIGVLQVDHLHPYGPRDAVMCFCPNPYITVTLPAWTRRIDRIAFHGNQWEHVQGVSPSAYVPDCENIFGDGSYANS